MQGWLRATQAARQPRRPAAGRRMGARGGPSPGRHGSRSSRAGRPLRDGMFHACHKDRTHASRDEGRLPAAWDAPSPGGPGRQSTGPGTRTAAPGATGRSNGISAAGAGRSSARLRAAGWDPCRTPAKPGAAGRNIPPGSHRPAAKAAGRPAHRPPGASPHAGQAAPRGHGDPWTPDAEDPPSGRCGKCPGVCGSVAREVLGAAPQRDGSPARGGRRRRGRWTGCSAAAAWAAAAMRSRGRCSETALPAYPQLPRCPHCVQ